MWENVKKALELVGLQEPNCLFIGSDVSTDYLHFAEIDFEDIEPLLAELETLGVVYVAKYETLAIERDKLWNARN